MLRECLDCLLSQTYRDFVVVIADNASTDETPQICAEYAAKDSRIRVVRHTENIGPLANFRYLLDRADTEFFMWRADDDLSDEMFLEQTVTALDKKPSSKLAIPRIVTEHSGGVRTPESDFQEVPEGGDFAERVIWRLYHYHVSGLYGLWRTGYLQETAARVWAAYPQSYACDHLTMLSVFLDDVAVAASKTLYIQRTYSPPKGDGLRGSRSLRDRIAMYEKLLPLFYDCFTQEIRFRNFPPAQEKRILSEMRRYGREKLRASRSRILRLRIKLALTGLYHLVLGRSH